MENALTSVPRCFTFLAHLWEPGAPAGCGPLLYEPDSLLGQRELVRLKLKHLLMVRIIKSNYPQDSIEIRMVHKESVLPLNLLGKSKCAF